MSKEAKQSRKGEKAKKAHKADGGKAAKKKRKKESAEEGPLSDVDRSLAAFESVLLPASKPTGGEMPPTDTDAVNRRLLARFGPPRPSGVPLLELPTIAVRPVEPEPPVSPQAAVPTARPRHRWRRVGAYWLGLIVVAALAALILRSFVFEAFFVPSNSMVPTLATGDRILVNKFRFSPKGLHDGDIIVFRTPEAARRACIATEGDLVKRVIATPGQVIYSIDNTVYVDGSALHESYASTLGHPITHQYLGPNQYFVMGDNRAISCDSRYWGPVNGTQIVGRVVAILWHNNRPALHLF